jgi:ATP-dependent Clp protease ATP-binding subunit ClpC
MFERYSERARRVLFFARYELSVLGGETIDPAHLLLGLLRDSKETDRLFASRNIPPAELRLKIEQRVTRGARFPTSVEIPFAAATIRVRTLRLRKPTAFFSKPSSLSISCSPCCAKTIQLLLQA